jgi:tRNA(Ile)-lysidine synthase
MDAARTLAAAVTSARADLPAGKILVACSGGPDSTALADALISSGADVAVACVDHGLRPAAAAEAAAVVAWAGSRGVAAAALRVVVDGKSMAAARRARYDALIAHARSIGAVAIAVAHTASDQAETLLDRLIRGAGTRGLAGMSPLRRIDGDVWLWRPLLAIDRATVEEYVRAKSLAVVRDPTNDDRAYRRSRIRHEVLPLMRRERPGLDAALAELCTRLRADADALDAVAAADRARLTLDDGSLDAAGLAALEDARFARVVARAAGIALEAVHVTALRKLCRDRRGTRSLDLPSQMRAERRYDRLSFVAQKKMAPPVTDEVAVARPGIYLLAGMEVTITPPLFESLGPGPFTLRLARPGDRVRVGKLSDWLVNEKVPRPERARLPVLARDAVVVWIGGGVRRAMCNNGF